MDKRFERLNRNTRNTAAALAALRNPRAVINREFAGRFFRVGNEFTNEVWGKTGTFNQAHDELEQAASCGNGGNAVGIIEVDAAGKPIKKPLPI